MAIFKETFCTNWPKADMLPSSEWAREAGNRRGGKKSDRVEEERKFKKIKFSNTTFHQIEVIGKLLTACSFLGAHSVIRSEDKSVLPMQTLTVYGLECK